MHYFIMSYRERGSESSSNWMTEEMGTDVSNDASFPKKSGEEKTTPEMEEENLWERNAKRHHPH